MRILVVGASGLIGSAVRAALVAEGHAVVGVVRTLRGGEAGLVAIDLAGPLSPEDWLPHLAGADAVVYCAGVLQDGPREDTGAVHRRGPETLVAACERAGVRRFVHVSAIGVDRLQPSAFSQSKRAGDAAVEASGLDWVILRPSLVLGRAAFGGSALMRGLAGLPLALSMPEAGALQPVQLDDVVTSVAVCVRPESPSRLALELAGPEVLSLDAVVALYRRWLGRPPAPRLPVPAFAAAGLYRLGDLAARLGWRPVVRSNARRELLRGGTGDPAPWSAATGIRPQGLAAALAAEPASVQERWFARLFFLKAAIFALLPPFWIVTGLVTLTFGYRAAVDLMVAAGAGALAAPTVIGGALADLVVGGLIAVRRTSRLGLLTAMGLSVAYIACGTLLRPDLWADPLGPLVKIVPILLLHLVALAILEER